MPSGKAGVDRPAKLFSQFSRGFVMKHKTLVLRIDQGEHNVVFSLRSIGVKDDSDYIQDLIAAEDEQYKANVEALAKWAAPYPADKPECDNPLDTEEKVREFFEDADDDKDWIANHAVYVHRERHQPKATFI